MPAPNSSGPSADKRITQLADLDGLSIKDAKRMPHATLLAKWSDAGLYTIDVNLGVFKVKR